MSFRIDLSQRVIKAASHDKPANNDADLPDLGLDLQEHQLSFQVSVLQNEVHTIQHALKEARDTHALRLSYTKKIFWLVVGWLACVVACIVLTGFKCYGFSLSEKVLIAFITSTTINVVGLFILVAKWMYAVPEKKKRKRGALRTRTMQTGKLPKT